MANPVSSQCWAFGIFHCGLEQMPRGKEAHVIWGVMKGNHRHSMLAAT